MSEAIQYPNFYEPVEDRPHLGAEQLAEAAQTFNELFDDLMLQGMNKVTRLEGTKGRSTAYLQRGIEVDGQNYNLVLSDEDPGDLTSETHDITYRDSEAITRDISLARVVEGYGRESWGYRLGADGIVRRWDGGDAMANSQKNRERIEKPRTPRGDETFEEIGRLMRANLQLVRADLQRMIYELPNDRLEEDMGLKNQPVTPDEVQGLRDFLTRATDVPG